MPCVYENIFPIDGENINTSLNENYKDQITLDRDTCFVGKPHIAFTLARDSDDYHRDIKFKTIELDSFNDSIKVGHKTVLYSEDNLGFENRPVRLNVVKINKGKAGKITIGDNVVMQGTVIVSYEEVCIGNNVLFGPQVTVMDSSGHPVVGRGSNDEAARTRSAKVTIKDNAWIGMGVTILKGVTIGENAVVGANSVVYEDVPDNSIAAGNPAIIVKHLHS